MSDKASLTVIDHLAINVADIEKSVRWYLSSFNCRLLTQQRTFAMLQFANTRLILLLPSEQPGHIAFALADAATHGELHQQPEGHWSAFIADPTGNPVELVSPQQGGTLQIPPS